MSKSHSFSLRYAILNESFPVLNTPPPLEHAVYTRFCWNSKYVCLSNIGEKEKEWLAVAVVIIIKGNCFVIGIILQRADCRLTAFRCYYYPGTLFQWCVLGQGTSPLNTSLSLRWKWVPGRTEVAMCTFSSMRHNGCRTVCFPWSWNGTRMNRWGGGGGGKCKIGW